MMVEGDGGGDGGGEGGGDGGDSVGDGGGDCGGDDAAVGDGGPVQSSDTMERPVGSQL